MENKELDELLEKIFSNVNSWLNFTEAKNAANVGFVVACLAAIFSLEDVNALLLNALLYTICIFLVISGMFSLISFLPKLGNKVIRKIPLFSKDKKRITDDDNLIFFENIKEYSGEVYIKQVCKMYFNKDEYTPTKYQLDLSDEIVYNSNVASCKYKLFKKAIYLDIIAFLILACSIIWA